VDPHTELEIKRLTSANSMDESAFGLLFTRQLRMRGEDEWHKVPMNSYLFYDSSAIAESEQVCSRRKAQCMQRIQVQFCLLLLLRNVSMPLRLRRTDNLYRRAYSIETIEPKLTTAIQRTIGTSVFV